MDKCNGSIGVDITSPTPSSIDLYVIGDFLIEVRLPLLAGLVSFLISLPKSEKSMRPFSVFESQLT